MAVGIECLISNDPAAAERIARELDRLNRERRLIEAGMHDNALAILDQLSPQDSYSLCLFDSAWHQGVIGILASRLKERWHRPVIAFAPGSGGEIKGSGRSISALHCATRSTWCRSASRLAAQVRRACGGSRADAARSRLRALQRRVRSGCASAAHAADLARSIETDGALPPGI